MLARGRDGRRASAPRCGRHQRARALPLDPDRGRRRAAADPGDPLSQGRFDGSALFRMNTVFKAGYQAFLLLGLAAGCALPWAARLAAAPCLDAVGGDRRGAADPRARLPLRGQLRQDRRLRQLALAGRPEVALGALAGRSGGDRLAARERRRATPSSSRPSATTTRPSATRRISTFTGRPTVIGWAGHEVQWQHDPGSRSADVQTLYTTPTSPPRRR